MSTVAPPESTIAATPIEPADSGWIPSSLYRFSLERYEELVESAAFTTRDLFHLINGYLVVKMTRNPPHTTADEPCREALQRVILPGWTMRGAKPVPSTPAAARGVADIRRRRSLVRIAWSRSAPICPMRLNIS
jgi:hypothetical protein